MRPNRRDKVRCLPDVIRRDFLPKGAEMSDPDIYQEWAHLRSQIEHEDGLVNQRLLWMLAFSGFLFASYGYTLTAEASLVASMTDCIECSLASSQAAESIRTLRISISIAGACIGFAALLGATAANCAIVTAVSAFPTDRVHGFYANPIGAGAAHKFGFLSGLAFPSVTVGVWMFLALVQLDVDRFLSVLISTGTCAVLILVSFEIISSIPSTSSAKTNSQSNEGKDV